MPTVKDKPDIRKILQETDDWYDSLSEGQKKWIEKRLQNAKEGELSKWDVNDILEKIEAV